MDEITVKYTKDIILHAAACFLRRTFGISGFIALIFVTVLGVGLLVSGIRTWYTMLFVSLSVVMTAIIIFVYVIYRKRAATSLEQLDDGKVLFQITEDNITISNRLGTSSVKWEAFQQLWQFKQVWLLIVSKGQYVTLPVDQFPNEVLGSYPF